MSYVYPMNKLEIIDGQLRPISSLPEDLVLVIERSYTGPLNTVYLVQDMSTAKTIYGDRSPLINLATRTLAGRAENIALFRIGGGAYEYKNLFGEATSLRLTEASVNASKDLKVYIGPEPKNSERQAVIVYEGSKIIFSNVLGGEIRSSRVALDGFDKKNNSVSVGTLENPVPFNDLLNHIGGEGKATVQPTQQEDNSQQWVVVTVASINGFQSDKSEVDSIRLTKDSGEVVKYTVSTDKTKLLINEYVDGLTENVKPTDTLNVTFIKKMTKEEREQLGIEFTEGKDSLNASPNELYEELDRALDQLELLPTKALVVGDWFNIPNLADGSAKPGNNDGLAFLKKGEDEDGYPVYQWSDHKTYYKKADQTTTEIAEADTDANGVPIVKDRYNEVDFAHRLGMFAFNKLEDGNFLNIVVGSKGPANTSPRALNEWVGTPPKRDLQGNIIENGSGLLGHRLMVGTTDYRGGFYATTNGYVDGDVITDRTGYPIDLGKHLSIVVSQVASLTDPNTTTSGAAAYAGLVSNLRPGESTTNMLVNNLFLASDIRESKRKQLSESGYVVFQDKPKGLTVYSGDLATRSTSDFSYISTAITVAEVGRLIVDVADNYIGKGMDFVLLTSFKTALTTALAQAQKEGWMNSFEFAIRRVGPNSLVVPYVIEAKDELRSVNNVVRLTRPDTQLEV